MIEAKPDEISLKYYVRWLPSLNASQEMVSKNENLPTRLRWIFAPNSVLALAFPRTMGRTWGSWMLTIWSPT
jgi:hypothetical protein